MIRTTIITPTTGSAELYDACNSVADQSVLAMHLIVIDGQENYDRAMEIILDVSVENPTYVPNIITLPYNVGAGGNYGHRIYAGIPSIVVTPFFAFLDQDNYLASNWVHKMQQTLDVHEDCRYATCRRTVVDSDKTIIGLDNKESIGKNDLGYVLYDTNTWMFRSSMALLTPYIAMPYHKGETGSWGGDRVLTETLYKVPHIHLEDYYGTFYRSPERLTQFFKEICDE